MLALDHWLVPKVSIGLTTFASTQFLLLANYQLASATPQKWQSVENAPRGLVQQVAKENFSQVHSQIDLQKMGVMKIQGQKQPLYIIDPRNDSLCGAAGCAYFGYISYRNGYHKVFSVYLNPNLPPQTPLITTTSKITFGLPCLKFTQLRSNRFEVIEWCYNGEKYNFFSSSLKPNQ